MFLPNLSAITNKLSVQFGTKGFLETITVAYCQAISREKQIFACVFIDCEKGKKTYDKVPR